LEKVTLSPDAGFTQRRLDGKQVVLTSVQMLPAQQGPPAPPHRAQMPRYEKFVSHTALASLHAFPPEVEKQQAWPRLPHVWHMGLAPRLSYSHRSPAPVHLSPAQQGLPEVPQVTQWRGVGL
jgi:hypothetical protein